MVSWFGWLFARSKDMHPIYYRHRTTGEYWTDLLPEAATLFVVVGRLPYRGGIDDIPSDYDRFEYRWASDEEWQQAQGDLFKIICVARGEK